MRDILFRAKTFDNEWVYGGICDYQSGTSILIVEHYDGSIDEPPHTDLNEVDVKTTTIGQFTGFLDTDEIQIFEGDIVLVVENGEMLHEGVVKFKHGAFFIDVPGFACIPMHSYKDETEFKIIGNIYDNQKWLEENK